MQNNIGSEKGFSLVEILVVVGIIVILLATVSYNYNNERYYRGELRRSAQYFANTMSEAQTRSAAASRYNDIFYCGYGITAAVDNQPYDGKAYHLYGGVHPDLPTICSDDPSKKYDIIRPRGFSSDANLKDYKLPGANIEFRQKFNDVFYEAPIPTTYIFNGEAGYDVVQQAIVINVKNTITCDVNTCATVCVYQSGRLDVKEGDSC